jgi:hypothetical protein
MALVVWDVDEVLADLRTAICLRTAPLLGAARADWREWSDYRRLWRHLGAADNAAFLAALVESRAYEECLPEAGAPEALAASAAAGNDNVLVTARGGHPDGFAATWDWLDRHGMAAHVAAVEVVPPFGAKTEVIAALGGAALIVEDSPWHVDAALAAGVADAALLVSRPWNVGWRPGGRPAERIAATAAAAAVFSRRPAP